MSRQLMGYYRGTLKFVSTSNSDSRLRRLDIRDTRKIPVDYNLFGAGWYGSYMTRVAQNPNLRWKRI